MIALTLPQSLILTLDLLVTVSSSIVLLVTSMRINRKLIRRLESAPAETIAVTASQSPGSTGGVGPLKPNVPS